MSDTLTRPMPPGGDVDEDDLAHAYSPEQVARIEAGLDATAFCGYQRPPGPAREPVAGEPVCEDCTVLWNAMPGTALRP